MNVIQFLLIYITISFAIHQATTTTTATVVCPFAHFLTSANTCVQCLTSCSKCKNLQRTCQGCAEGFKLSFDGAKCNTCQKGELTCEKNQKLCQRYYKKQNQQCKSLCIVQNCRTCSSIFAKVCQLCLNGYKISVDRTSCIQQKSAKVSSVQHRHLQQTSSISNFNTETISKTSTSIISSTSTNNFQSLSSQGIGSTSARSITITSTIDSNTTKIQTTGSTSSIGTNLQNNNSPTNLESTTNINNLRPNIAGETNINNINTAQFSNLNLPSSSNTTINSRTSTTTSNSSGAINQPSLNINSNINTNSGKTQNVSSIIGIQPLITTSSTTYDGFGSNINTGTTLSTNTGTETPTSPPIVDPKINEPTTPSIVFPNQNITNNMGNTSRTIITNSKQIISNNTKIITIEEVPPKIVMINHECLINQFYDPLSGCLPCNSKCATCIRTADQCLECQNNRTMIGWKCVTKQHVLYNISLRVPKGQQDYALGEGVNQFKRNFVQSFLPGASTSSLALISAKLDSTKNILHLSGIVDIFRNISITTLSNNIATKLNTSKNLGIFEVINSSVAAQTDFKPPTNNMQQVTTNTNTADDLSNKGPNLASIIVPSVLSGIMLLSSLICWVFYSYKCCCFKRKQNQAQLNKNIDTQRKFQQKKIQNVIFPTTGVIVPPSIINTRPITPITPVSIDAAHKQIIPIKKISQIKQEPIPVIIPTYTAQINNKIEQMKIDIKNNQKLKINEAHKIDTQGGTNLSEQSVKKITPKIEQMWLSNNLNIIQKSNNTISNKEVQNIVVINNQNTIQNIRNLKISNINNQIVIPNTNTSQSSHVNNQIIIPRVAYQNNTYENYTYINTYRQHNGGALRNQQLIEETSKAITATIVTTPVIQSTTGGGLSKQIQYIQNNKNLVAKSTQKNQHYHSIIVNQQINTNISSRNLLITTNQQRNSLYDNQNDNQYNKQYYYQQNKNISGGQSGILYITSNQAITSPSRGISYQTIPSRGTIPLLQQQDQKVQRKAIVPTSSKVIQGQVVSYLTGNITRHFFKDGKLVSQHICFNENMPDNGFTYYQKKYQYGNEDPKKITKIYAQQQWKDLGTQGLKNQTQFYQIKQQHYDQGWKYEDKKN